MSIKKSNKKPYTERTLTEQMETNLRKTKKLLDRKEYSTAIVRSITTLDLYVTGLIKKSLQEKLSEKMTKSVLAKYRNLPDKLKLLMEECYGFSAAKEFPNQYNQLLKDIETRTKIVHKGRFSNKSTADKAVKNVEKLISLIQNKINLD